MAERDPRIIPNQLFRLPIMDGEIIVGQAYDTMHYFPWLGTYMLKYYQDETKKLRNVMMKPDSARYIMDVCGIAVAERETITDLEYDQYLEWEAETLMEGDFGL